MKKQGKQKSTVSAKAAKPKARKSTNVSPSKKAASRASSGKRIPKARPPRKESALDRLGVEPEQLDAAARITDILSSVFKTGKKAPRLQILNFLAASPSPAARSYLDKYREMGVRDRESVPIEAICIAAGVDPLQILGAILMAAKSLKAQESALKAIIAHPDIVEATINAATKGSPVIVDGRPYLDKNGDPLMLGFGDDRAQKMMHEAVGFLPTKQGSNIAINLGIPGAQPTKELSEGGDDEMESFEEAFPTISGKLESWSENRRMLTEGK